MSRPTLPRPVRDEAAERTAPGDRASADRASAGQTTPDATARVGAAVSQGWQAITERARLAKQARAARSTRDARPTRDARQATAAGADAEPTGTSRRREARLPAREVGARARSRVHQSTVVSLSAVRDLARRARRARLSKRVGIGLGAAAAIGCLLVYLFFFSPWLALRSVELVGGDRFGNSQLQSIVGGQMGQPLALVDTAAVQRGVQQDPAVKSARVVRVWPGTLEVRVSERVPVLAVPVPATDPATGLPGEPDSTTTEGSGGYALMAADGVVVETVAEIPEAMTATDAQTVAAGDDAVEAAAAVMAALPPGLQSKVTTISANSRDSVLFHMTVPVTEKKLDLKAKQKPTPTKTKTSDEPQTREVVVVWGSVDESSLKAEVLAALLQTDAKVYDVSSPSTPVTRDGTSPTPTLDASPEPDSAATGDTSTQDAASADASSAAAATDGAAESVSTQTSTSAATAGTDGATAAATSGADLPAATPIAPTAASDGATP